MVDLNALYQRARASSLAANELPDYLPALLEYLSTRPAEEVHEMLDDCVHILRAVGERLVDGGSPYAAVFAALLDLHGAAPLAAAKRAAKRRPQPSLDEDWDEAPVEFGPRRVSMRPRRTARSSRARSSSASFPSNP